MPRCDETLATQVAPRQHKEEFAARLSGLANALESEVQSTVMAVMEQASGIADLAERMKAAAGRTGEQSSGNVIKLEGIKVFIERCRKADKIVLS
jgi:hypothetical protein